jgi:hypothetical protein
VDVVVHGLGNGYDVKALAMKAKPVTQGVVTSNRQESVDSQPLEYLEDVRRAVIRRLAAGHRKEVWQVLPCHLPRIGS